MLRQRAPGSEKRCRRGWPAIYLVNKQASCQLSRNADSEYKMGQVNDEVSRGRAIREHVYLANRPYFPEEVSGAEWIDVWRLEVLERAVVSSVCAKKQFYDAHEKSRVMLD